MKKKLIISDSAVMMRKPIIAGTRITVELILDKLAANSLRNEVVYPIQEVARTFWRTKV